MAAKKVNKSKVKSKAVSNKGISFISDVLRRNKTQYPNRESARGKAKELLKIFRDRKELITIKGIKKYMKTTSETKKPKKGVKVPFVVAEMFEVLPFYDLAQYSQMISDSDENVTFVSDIFDYSAPALKGGDYADYPTYFRAYVNYCNEFVSQDREEYDNSDWAGENMCVMTLPPEQDVRGRWIAKIIVCDGMGTPIEDMYGFAPDGESDFDKADAQVLPVERGKKKKQKEKKKKEAKESKGKGKGESIEELRLRASIIESEAKKAEAQASKFKELSQLLREGLIKESTYIKMVKELNKGK